MAPFFLDTLVNFFITSQKNNLLTCKLVSIKITKMFKTSEYCFLKNILPKKKKS